MVERHAHKGDGVVAETPPIRELDDAFEIPVREEHTLRGAGPTASEHLQRHPVGMATAQDDATSISRPWKVNGFAPWEGPSDGIAVGTALGGVERPPRRSSVRDYRTGLLPRVRALKRTLGKKGCIIRAGGSHRVTRRFIRVQLRR